MEVELKVTGTKSVIAKYLLSLGFQDWYIPCDQKWFNYMRVMVYTKKEGLTSAWWFWPCHTSQFNTWEEISLKEFKVRYGTVKNK